MNRLLSLPLLVVIGTYGWVGQKWLFPAIVGVFALGRVLLKQGFPVGKTAQRVTIVAVGLLTGFALNSTLPLRAPRVHTVLSPGGQVVAGAFLAAAVLHACFRRPFGGAWFTLGLALIAMAACGRVKSGGVYLVCAAIFALAAIWSANQRSGVRTPPNTRRRLLIALGMVGASAITMTLVLSLPKAQAWAVRRVLSHQRERVAFSDRLWLGSMQPLIASDKAVLRLRGQHHELLRGAVYTFYAEGQWQRESQGSVIQSVPNERPRSAHLTALEFVGSESDHYFLPLEAANVGTSPGTVRAGAFGVLSPLVTETPGEIWFTPDFDVPAVKDLARPIDAAVPGRLLGPLQRFAESWTRGAQTPLQVLTALESKLRSDYAYSLEFEAPDTHDPVLYFLRYRRSGHCEYFASAMALLSRSLGIPARVVTGYRVSEYSPLGSYFIVRERDAHAWVEAYLPNQGWRTFDPTPASELSLGTRRATPFFGAVGDLLRLVNSRFLAWLDQRTWLEIIGSLLGLVVLNALVSLQRERTQRRKSLEGRPNETPLPCFEALCQTLGARGVLRAPSETVEALARRLPEGKLSPAERARVETLLASYVALRFGDRGNPHEIQAAMQRCADELAAPPPA